jgi:hypothetical protein
MLRQSIAGQDRELDKSLFSQELIRRFHQAIHMFLRVLLPLKQQKRQPRWPKLNLNSVSWQSHEYTQPQLKSSLI